MRKTKPTILISVDVEDWPQSSWDRSLPLGDYCADNTKRVLDILCEFPSARVTFFVLGKFAERHPNILELIKHKGHEIGSHGYGHVELFRLGRERFSKDLERSTQLIIDTCGVQPIGYRAPDFSIVVESLWALEVLAEQGYKYDSSIFPIGKARYGIANWPRSPVGVRLKAGGIITEFPLATLELFGRRFPIGGGGYARLMPAGILTRAFHKAEAQLKFPPVFYCHPYELDPEEFKRISFRIPFKIRMHQGMGRKHTAYKLRQLLSHFNCISIGDALAQLDTLPMIDYQPFVLEPGSVHRPPPLEGAKVQPDESTP